MLKSSNMPRRIRSINWITHAIHIRIQPTSTKRTPTVRALESHQPRVVSTVTVTQQIPANFRFAYLSIEAQPRSILLLRGLLAVSGVGDGVMFAVDDFAND